MRYRVLFGVLCLGLTSPLFASVEFVGSSGNLKASALFEVSGTNLIVTLTNTSTNDVLVPADVLTAVFFNLEGSPSLTPVSALLASGSTVHFSPVTVSGGDVGGEWAYKSGFTGPDIVDGATSGISSVGLDLFGPPDRFDTGANLQGPNSPDGLQFGITSDGDDTSTGNTPVTGTNALIENSVVFTLSDLASGFEASDDTITDVSFQYGTSLDEPRFPGDPDGGVDIEDVVPEPSTLAAWCLLGLCGVISLRRRRR